MAQGPKRPKGGGDKQRTPLDLVKHFADRKTRAHQRLEEEEAARPAGSALYLGISSIKLEGPLIYLGAQQSPLAMVRELLEPPGEIELARSLKDQAIFGYLAKYARSFSHELIVPAPKGDLQAALNLAWDICSLLRVRAVGEFICPAYASHSWDTIAAISNNGVVVGFLDEYPNAVSFSGPPTLVSEDFQWVEKNVENWFVVWEVESFRLASGAYMSYPHHPDLRLMAANLWSGVEALFGFHGELRFRLAVVIASLLEPRGPARVAQYTKLMKLYDARSKVVHGAKMAENQLKDHVLEVSGILGRLLALCIERRQVWSRPELDGAVMG